MTALSNAQSIETSGFSMPPRHPVSESAPGRSMASLQQRQQHGDLRVLTAADYRALVAQVGLEQAFAQTDVVAAADAGFCDQGSLALSLGPSDPPIRLREVEVAGVAGLVCGSSGELQLPLGGGLADPGRGSGAQVVTALLAGQHVALSALGEPTRMQPRLELSGSVTLAQLAGARLLLQRAIVENGIVAVSSAEGLLQTAYGPLLGPLASGLYSAAGPGSIGLAMPGLSQLGPGSPVLVGGAVGWVVGSGSGHNPAVARSASGHALGPGATAAVMVDLADVPAAGLRSCFLAGHGAALLVPIAAPVPLLTLQQAAQAAAGAAELEAPVLDLAVPRRVKPRLASASYEALLAGSIRLEGRRLRCAPSHSPALAAAAAQQLVDRLQQGLFPLQPPIAALPRRSALVPLDL